MDILKKIAGIVFRICISAVLLWFLFRQVDIKGFLQIIRQAQIWFILLSFFLVLTLDVLCFFRWNMLLVASGVKLPVLSVIRPFAGSIFFNMFLPTTIGGDFVRGADLSVSTRKTSHVVASVLLDRLSGYVALVIVALGALLVGHKLIIDKRIIALLAGMSILLFFILLFFVQ